MARHATRMLLAHAAWLLLAGAPAAAAPVPPGSDARSAPAAGAPDASAPGSTPQAPAPAPAPAPERFALVAGPGCDSLLARATGGADWRARAWTRPELVGLCERLRAERAAAGALGERVTLTLAPGWAGDPGTARIAIEGAARGGAPPRAEGRVAGAPGDPARARALFERACGPAATPARIAAGLAALLEEARSLGYAGAEAQLDSVRPADGVARLYVSVHPGPLVRVESLELRGSTSMRPGPARAIAGLPRGALVTPAALASARERLQASELFASVGEPEAVPGSTPELARVVVPVEEVRASRFEGALGLQNGGGVTGLLDLALGNIGGTGRSVGARWHGFGEGRSQYAARYREPALLGRPLDASLALDGDLAESLYTTTQWSLRLGARPWTRARASLGVERSGTVYTGAASGTSETWSLEGGFGYEGQTPRINPDRGIAASVSLSAGRRSEAYAGAAPDRRGIARASLTGSVALPAGARRALVAALRFDRVTLSRGPGFPAEELRFLGGSEGLRGHADREFAGDRILAASLEHRWIGSGESRTYLFLDAAHHALGSPVVAGSAPIAPSLLAAGPAAAAGSLARTRLSDGWEFGYGAGLRTRLASGAVGIELGYAPGASIREGKLHLHYASNW